MRVIIDTDIGQDDAVALLLALGSAALDIIGITTVSGNVDVEHTFRNARTITALASRPDIPVSRGCDRPIVIPPRTGAHVHGTNGLGGYDFPEPVYQGTGTHAVQWLLDTLLVQEDASITIVAIGPLTNVALAIRLNPIIRSKIRQIVFMGGGYFEGGNSTPSAEFNVLYDPHAADIVFRSGIPLVVAPLDLTQQIIADSADLEAFRASNRRVGEVLTACMTFYSAYDSQRYGIEGAILHDPCAVAYLLDPSAFEGKDVFASIELNGSATFGMTVVDWWGVTNSQPNCRWLRTADRSAIFRSINAAIANLEN